MDTPGLNKKTELTLWSTNTMSKPALKVDFSLVLVCMKALRRVSQAFILASLANTLENQAFSLLYSRTTDAQRGNSLHYTAENSIPIPNF